jgi:chorismate synthase
MSHNSFGTNITITTFGESHGAAVGVIMDGLKGNFPFDLEFIQSEMDRRRPGGNTLGTPREEADTIKVLSGVYNNKITGTPLTMIVENTNQKSKDYSKIEDAFRPGHADYTYFKKYGIRDPRGGGRSSGRETVARVAAGAVSKLYLNECGISIEAATIQIGSIKVDKNNIDWEERVNNELYCPNGEKAKEMSCLINDLRLQGDSIGGVIECRIKGLPVGLGDPAFDKIEALLAHAIMSIGATKGFEIGDGFAAASLKGSQNNDENSTEGFLSNHCGGTLGGISTGQDLIFRVAFKPTPSISFAQKTITKDNKDTVITIEGRHDPCICPRAVVVVEAMSAIVILDLYSQLPLEAN